MAIPGGGGGGKGARMVGGSGGLASRLNFVKPPGADLAVVRIDVAKLNASLAGDRGFFVGPGGAGGIGGRYPNAGTFLGRAAETGQGVQMTRVYVDREGRATIGDGRHRFAVLRDAGATSIPVVVPRGNADRLRRLFGAD